MRHRPFVHLPRAPHPRRTFVALLAATLAAGCISAPEVVLVDRKTLLEEQAGGELVALENELRAHVIVPEAAPLSRAQLEAAGHDTSGDTLAGIVAIHAILRGDVELVDDLLRRRCIGEATDGLLVETPGTCVGRTSASQTTVALGRINRARRQLWQHLHTLAPDVEEGELRRRWRGHHLQTVVCSGQIQADDESWSIKAC